MPMTQWIAILAIFVAIQLTSCGRQNASTRSPLTDPGPVPTLPPTPPGPTGPKLQIYFFGNETCDDCKKVIPETQSIADALPPEQRARLVMTLLVSCAGSPCNVKPTQEIADRYRDQLHLNFKAAADPWRWTWFRKFIPGKLQVPAAAVLDEKGEILRAFPAGSTSFVPSEIVQFAVSQLK